MHVKINVRDFAYKLIVVFLSVYAFTRGGIGLLVPTSMWSLGLLVVLIVSLCLLLGKKNRNVKRISIFIIFMVIEIILWYNWDFINGTWFLNLVLITFYIFVLAAKNNSSWFDTAIRMILIMGIFHAFWTIACYLSSDIYYNIVYPVVNSISQWSLSAMYNKGFMTGFNYTNSQDAIYLTSALIVCVCMLFFNDSSIQIKKSKWIRIVLLIAIAGSLLLTGKRGPIVWFSVAFIITYWIYNCDRSLGRLFKIVSIVVLVIAVVYVASFMVSGLLNFVYRFIEMSEQGNITTHRTELWGMGWQGFLDAPVFGHGWFWFKYHNSYGITYHVHNCYIQWLCELGIVGAVPWFAFVISNMSHTIKMIRAIKLKNYDNYNGRMLKHLAFSLLYQWYFLIYSFAATSFYEPECLLPYIFSCGMSMYYWGIFKRREYIKGEIV